MTPVEALTLALKLAIEASIKLATHSHHSPLRSHLERAVRHEVHDQTDYIRTLCY